ncbi:hypothetical protein EXIGLDRAFT_760309 [Exidia glandulosa HHB12029]|uniref:Vacuolar protein sorting-associated protein 62 n=1 Tax=Exidia glandulosa HHB12029 TaxID=1314781 RepID=A0A165PFA3_EXIGL|nr:hypothetical protein EXIGLDRAFT_760309 [Exidia glandulosa HHB12029]
MSAPPVPLAAPPVEHQHEHDEPKNPADVLAAPLAGDPNAASHAATTTPAPVLDVPHDKRDPHDRPKSPADVVAAQAPHPPAPGATPIAPVQTTPGASTTSTAQGPAPTAPVDNIPKYALDHAPLVWLDKDEIFWPGNVLIHLQNIHPETALGRNLDIPKELEGKTGAALLAHPTINDGAVFLAYNTDPRTHIAKHIGTLTSAECKPHGETRKSDSTAYIVTVDKSKELGEGFVDVFYFYFYPYNYGAAVVGIHFGNHIGDWEHTMIRFKHGEPQAIHLSAHSDGHAYKLTCLETIDNRPVVYSASGSHANYPRAGVQKYSGVPGGPVDHTSRGFLWDPLKNYVSLSYSNSKCVFTPHTPWPEACASPFPTPDDAVSILSFKGHWGNAFADYRHAKPGKFLPKIGQKFADMKRKVTGDDHEPATQEAETEESTSIDQKYHKLVWGEGPTGPRDKSLDRATMNRWSEAVTETL